MELYYFINSFNYNNTFSLWLKKKNFKNKRLNNIILN